MMKTADPRLTLILLGTALSVGGCADSGGGAGDPQIPDDEPGGATVVSVADRSRLIDEIADVSGLRRLDTLVDRVPLLDLAYPPLDEEPTHPGMTLTEADFGSQTFEFDCANGGTYRVATVDTFTDRIVMRDCDLDGTSLGGEVLHRYAPGTSDDTYERLRAESADGVVETLSGRRVRIRTDRDSIPRSLDWTVDEYVRDTGTGTISLRDGLGRVEVGPTYGGSQFAERTFESGMTVTAPWTGDRPMTLATSVPFGDFADAGHYRVGTLRAVAADGSALEMIADDGDPDSFTALITAGGATTAFAVEWDETNRLRCFAPAGEAESLHGCD